MNSQKDVTVYPSLPELTFRGMFLGMLITVIFTASNVYLGLKVGLTFSSSIPAAVISMAILRMFKDSNILENNMVRCRYAVSHHLHSSRPFNAGLLAGIPLLANHGSLCLRRLVGCLVHHSFTSCHGRKQRSSLS